MMNAVVNNGEYVLVVRYPDGTVLAERAVPPDEAITTTLREWMLSDDWTGLCEGMTISVERANRQSIADDR